MPPRDIFPRDFYAEGDNEWGSSQRLLPTPPRFRDEDEVRHAYLIGEELPCDEVRLLPYEAGNIMVYFLCESRLICDDGGAVASIATYTQGNWSWVEDWTLLAAHWRGTEAGQGEGEKGDMEGSGE